jgi:penicillin-binding protein 2
VRVPRLPRSETEMVRTFRRLGNVLDLSTRRVHERVIESIADQPYANITVKSAVPRAAFNYIKERQERFPGVTAEKRYVRSYPHDKLAAQLFGTVREISPKETKEKRYRDVPRGTRIGKDGIEETYDRYLRGQDGFSRVVVNALGERDDRRAVKRVEPTQGQRLRLTLDLGLERAAHKAMARAIASAPGAKAGAYVAMDPKSGEVMALGSYPSFNANVFTKPLSNETYKRLTSEENGAPLFNRAIAAGYPTGSTFKPITALGGLEEGVITPSTPVSDTGVFKLGPQEFKNAGDEAYGLITLEKAMQVSSDVYFYKLGADANSRGAILQRWARRLGMGHRTGIDLPGEAAGLMPDRRWRDTEFAKYERCAKKARVPVGTTAALFKCGGIERPWSAGDNVNLAVGQGDLQATPLQLATAYSTIVNGGTVVRPHLGAAIEDGTGREVDTIRKPARRKLRINEEYRDVIMEGLRKAAMEPTGTSYDVFKGFAGGRLTVYGKTGTAERQGQEDQSWYAAYVPHPSKPIVVAVTIEKGGWGAETAAPAARLILSDWFDLRDREFRKGSSQTR